MYLEKLKGKRNHLCVHCQPRMYTPHLSLHGMWPCRRLFMRGVTLRTEWAAPSCCCCRKVPKAEPRPREEFDIKVFLSFVGFTAASSFSPDFYLDSQQSHFERFTQTEYMDCLWLRDRSESIVSAHTFPSHFSVFIHFIPWWDGASVRNLMLTKSKCSWLSLSVVRVRLPLVFLQVGHVSNLCWWRWKRTPEEFPHRERVTEMCVRRLVGGGPPIERPSLNDGKRGSFFF